MRIDWRFFQQASNLLLVIGAMLLSSCALPEMFRTQDPPLPGTRIAVLQFDRGLQIDKTLERTAVELSSSKPLRAWTQAGGVATNAPYHIAGRPRLEPLFTRKVVTGSQARIRLTAPPIAANGLVYVLGADMVLTAVNGRTGEERWIQNLRQPGTALRDGFGGGLALARGVIYAATGFGEIIALRARDGAIIWRQQRSVPLRTAPTVRDGRVFVIGHDSRLLVLSTEDGSILWEHGGLGESATILAAPSVAVNNQLVIAGFNSGELQSLRVTNGLRNWRDTLSPPGQQVTPLSEINGIIARPVLDIDRVFAVSHSGQMVAIDVRSGRRIWNEDYASIQMPWVSGNVIYLMTLDAQLLCIHRATGKLRWVRQFEKTLADSDEVMQWAGPILVGGRLLLVSSAGDFASVSPQTGRVYEIRALSEPVKLAPIAANGIVYVLGDDGTLFAFR